MERSKKAWFIESTQDGQSEVLSRLYVIRDPLKENLYRTIITATMVCGS